MGDSSNGAGAGVGGCSPTDNHEPVHTLVVAPGAAVTAMLIAFAWGYGYHRDELYFLVAGRHLAWAYPDQGPLVPLLARAMSEIAPQSLTLLRLPSAVAAGATVTITGLPPDTVAPVIVVGLARDEAGRYFKGCTVAARITNRANVRNEERGKAVMVCAGPVRPWSVEWPSLRHFG